MKKHELDVIVSLIKNRRKENVRSPKKEQYAISMLNTTLMDLEITIKAFYEAIAKEPE